MNFTANQQFELSYGKIDKLNQSCNNSA